MVIPEHLRAELTRLRVLLEYQSQLVTQLEAQQRQLVLLGTGVDINAGTWQLTPEWSLEQANVPPAG